MAAVPQHLDAARDRRDRLRDALLDLDRTRRGRDDRPADAEVLPEFEGLAGSPPRASAA